MHRTGAPRDIVVLIHGLGRSWRSLLPVRFSLARQGYQVASFSYPSSRLTVGRVVSECLNPWLAKLRIPAGARVHFVTHSLGGIIFRAWAAQRPQDFPLGRSVLLVPPNQGSEVLQHLARKPWVRRLLGPVLNELGTEETSTPRRLGPVPPGTGVLMGNKPITPMFRQLLGPESDGIVTVAGGWVEGQADFMITPADHTFIMWRPQVLAAVSHFLENGRFMPRLAVPAVVPARPATEAFSGAMTTH